MSRACRVLALLLVALAVPFGAPRAKASGAGWSAAAGMANPRTCQSAALLASGKVLIIGGYGSLTSAELYDPATNSWSAAGNMQSGRACPTSTRLTDGKVLVVGGTPDNS